MASISANGSRGHHRFTLNTVETSVSGGAENYSVVYWELVLSPIQTGWDWYWQSPPVRCNVIINGEYVLNNKDIYSYDGRSTVTIASGSLTVPHNADGSKTITLEFNVWDLVTANYLPGSAHADGSMALTNIPRYLESIGLYEYGSGLDYIVAYWICNPARDYTQYSLNGGAWIDAGDSVASDNKSGSFAISGLTPNTTYSLKIRLRRQDSGLWSESGTIYISTKDIARISSAPNLNFGDNVTISKTNPSGAYNRIRIETLNPTTTIATRNNITSDNPTIVLTDDEWDNLYKKLGNNNSMTIRYVVDTVGNNTWFDWVDRTLVLTGNKKTIKTKISGNWRRGNIWVKANGTWRRAVIWQKINGTWRRGI